MKTKRHFYNINTIVNANCTPMVDGSNWINWAKNRLNEGLSYHSLNRIADILNK